MGNKQETEYRINVITVSFFMLYTKQTKKVRAFLSCFPTHNVWSLPLNNPSITSTLAFFVMTMLV